MITRTVCVFFIAACLTSLSACSGSQSSSPAQPASTSSSSSLIAGAIDHALDEASAKIARHNITVSSDDDNLPEAEITPQGDFLIAGKPVPLTKSQRKQVLAYRHQMVEIAQQGIAVGKQGAELGLKVASTAIAGALSGQSDEQIRQRIEAKTSGIRQAATKICDRLPALMKSQQNWRPTCPPSGPMPT